jgi:Zn-dependent oligopeptidase
MARANPHKWSKQVTEHSDALDLKQGVFKQKDPQRIAASLKDSAEHSERRKSDPYRSAMSMLTFYINRAGAQLPEEERDRLEKAKDALRNLYQRPSSGRTTPLGRRVEKPGSGSPAGPSGQRDKAKHDGKHTNK